MSIRTIEELQARLGGKGSLSNLLKPDDFAPEDAVASQIALAYKEKLKPTQTRRIFNTIKQIESTHKTDGDGVALSDDDRMRLTLLGPDLAYAAGRELIPKEFYDIIKLMLSRDKLQTVGDLRRLVQFLTAIVAYQKYHAKFSSKPKE